MKPSLLTLLRLQNRGPRFTRRLARRLAYRWYPVMMGALDHEIAETEASIRAEMDAAIFGTGPATYRGIEAFLNREDAA